MERTEKQLIAKIEQLKSAHRAVIFAHNYQVGEIQDVADFVGDSLELAQRAARTDADVIVFCGVHFMAETAAILCPTQTVLMPDLAAGCGMAEMISADAVRRMKAEHPNAVVVCYVNSSAAVKAEADICCTSSNAKTIVSSISQDREILFIPDQYLGAHVMRETGRPLILFNGYCPTHVRIRASELEAVMADHPDAILLAHPECTDAVGRRATHVVSTSGIAAQARKMSASTAVVATEIGMLHRLAKENPEKTFIPACRSCDCGHMKVNTLEKLLWSLEEMQYPITVEPEIAARARQAIEAMLDISRSGCFS